MAISCGFFNSVGGDRKYNADDISNYFDKLITNGIYHDTENAMQVEPSGGLAVTIRPGRAIINCKWLKNDTIHTIAIDQPNTVLDRIDRIVAWLDVSENVRYMGFSAIKGTPASNPVPPPVSADANITMLTLAYVRVRASTTGIMLADITDTRADSGICGWVRLLVDSSSGGSGTLKKYQSHQTLTIEQNIIYPNLANYVDGDILQVYCGGILLVEGVEYTISGTGSAAQLNLVRSIKAGNEITCILLKVE